jgi:hypothetical protein
VTTKTKTQGSRVINQHTSKRVRGRNGGVRAQKSESERVQVYTRRGACDAQLRSPPAACVTCLSPFFLPSSFPPTVLLQHYFLSISPVFPLSLTILVSKVSASHSSFQTSNMTIPIPQISYPPAHFPLEVLNNTSPPRAMEYPTHTHTPRLMRNDAKEKGTHQRPANA